MGTDDVQVLQRAEAQRTATLLHHTIDQRPTWLTGWLTELHVDGRLTQLGDHVVLTAITEIAEYRYRWQITSLDPTGLQPSPETEQFSSWQRAVKVAGITHSVQPTPEMDLASQR